MPDSNPFEELIGVQGGELGDVARILSGIHVEEARLVFNHILNENKNFNDIGKYAAKAFLSIIEFAEKFQKEFDYPSNKFGFNPKDPPSVSDPEWNIE